MSNISIKPFLDISLLFCLFVFQRFLVSLSLSHTHPLSLTYSLSLSPSPSFPLSPPQTISLSLFFSNFIFFIWHNAWMGERFPSWATQFLTNISNLFSSSLIPSTMVMVWPIFTMPLTSLDQGPLPTLILNKISLIRWKLLTFRLEKRNYFPVRLRNRFISAGIKLIKLKPAFLPRAFVPCQ